MECREVVPVEGAGNEIAFVVCDFEDESHFCCEVAESVRYHDCVETSGPFPEGHWDFISWFISAVAADP